ncbi:enoyl-CoA hydratase/isomerase family protein [Candidatus Colwellia aromaticivorans]|uniref:enoyl-CoA hydratase/isomerase family protein n=1 Tax=Candidatus Colwellia aromaticivorans TaxID=2267621 RepID=UPI000DF14882|nr:enoyl-CoA hydratase/isomerase family protein [Candidatus Colwellia aromaticivorans]
MTQVVTFQEIDSANGKKIAVITLNSPKSLNALGMDMIALIYPKLKQWQTQDDIAAVFLQGEGDKAFCAGGDIVYMYNDIIADKGNFSPGVEKYFTTEYELDYFIHTFNKPFIVWGNGIVMGGGLGLMVGGSHRIVTENSRIAMPEISIGLYPDVGGSYFLNRMPNNCGMFLGLTGASINAADAKYSHLADYFVASDNKDSLMEQLTQVDWQDSITLNHEKLSSLLTDFENDSISLLPESKLTEHETLINQVTSFNNLASIVEGILAVEVDDKWFVRAQKSLKSGSPLSASLTFQQIQSGASLSLADCFRMELNLSVKAGKFGEFTEGVRALLIDKDNSPKWHFSSVETVDNKVIDWFFESKWTPEQHPLANLGN